MGFFEGLAKTESGGNYQANRTNKDGRSYFGRLQFGEARLKDLGLGTDFTMEQFKADTPEGRALQDTVQARHFADIKQYVADQGLDKAYGTNIGGVPFNENAAMAVAHLGGNAGLKRYVTSGGAYNPSDELGTSLADYARTHGGSPAAALGVNRMDTETSKPGNPLRTFAEDMRGASSTSAKMLAAAINPPFRPTPFGSNVGNPQQPYSFGGGATPTRPGASPYSFGAGVPNMPANIPRNADPTNFGATGPAPAMGSPYPIGEPINSPPAGAGSPPPRTGPAPAGNYPVGTPTSGGTAGGAGEDKLDKAGFGQRIAEKLFPKSENPKENLATVLQALSTGLGQMSHGQPVDLSSLFQRMATGRQASITNKRLAENEQFDRNLATAKYNLDVAGEARLSAKALAGGDGTVDYTSTLQTYPELTDLVSQAQSGNKKAADEIAKYTAEKAAFNLQAPEERAALQEYLAAEDVEGRAASVANLTPEAQQRVSELGNTIGDKKSVDPVATRIGERLFAEMPGRFENVGEAIEYAAKLEGGITPGLSDAEVAANIKNGDALYEEHRTNAKTAQLSLMALDEADRAIDTLIETGDEIAGTDETLISLGKIIGGYAGSETMYAALKAMGIDPDVNQKLSSAQTVLMRGIAASYTGQGTISDQERAMMMKEVVGPDLTTKRAAELSAKLRADNMIKMTNSKYYRSEVRTSKANANWKELDGDITAQFDAAREIVEAASMYAIYQYNADAGTTGGEKDSYMERFGGDENREARNDMILPRIQSHSATRYVDALPYTKDKNGKLRRSYIDPRTNEVSYAD